LVVGDTDIVCKQWLSHKDCNTAREHVKVFPREWRIYLKLSE
jgi:hypothetical protein